MLFEELIPLDCLCLSELSFDYLKNSHIHTVRAFKQHRQKIIVTMYDDLRLVDLDFLDTINSWRNDNKDLGVVTIPNDAVPSLPPHTIVNFLNERTIIQNYTVRFQITRNEIFDDLPLSEIRRFPGAFSKLLTKAGCHTMRDVLAMSYEHLEDISGGDVRLLNSLVEWFLKKCVFEFEPGLKPPFTRIDVPEDIEPAVWTLYDDINSGALVIDFEDIIAALLSIRSYVVRKIKLAVNIGSPLGDTAFMKKIYSLPSFKAAAAKLVGLIIEKHKREGVTSQEIDSELPDSVCSAGGAAKFLPILLRKGIIEEQFRAFFPALRSADGHPKGSKCKSSASKGNKSKAGTSNAGTSNTGTPDGNASKSGTPNASTSNAGTPTAGTSNAANATPPADDPKKLLHDNISAEYKEGKNIEDVMQQYGVIEYYVLKIYIENLERELARPPVLADRYRYWYDNYKMTKKEFCFIFDVDEDVFNSLKRKGYYYKGRKEIKKMLLNERATDDIAQRIWQLLRGK